MSMRAILLFLVLSLAGCANSVETAEEPDQSVFDGQNGQLFFNWFHGQTEITLTETASPFDPPIASPRTLRCLSSLKNDASGSYKLNKLADGSVGAKTSNATCRLFVNGDVPTLFTSSRGELVIRQTKKTSGAFGGEFDVELNATFDDEAKEAQSIHLIGGGTAVMVGET